MNELGNRTMLASMWRDVFASEGGLSDSTLDGIRGWMNDSTADDLVRLLRVVYGAGKIGAKS